MIRNDFTNETAHVANWFLYSGVIDLVELYRRAESEAKARAAKFAERHPDLPEDERNDYSGELYEVLEQLATDAYDEAICDVLPGWLDGYGGYIGMEEYEYRDMNTAEMVLRLCNVTFLSIDFRAIARLIAEHVNQSAAA